MNTRIPVFEIFNQSIRLPFETPWQVLKLEIPLLLVGALFIALFILLGEQLTPTLAVILGLAAVLLFILTLVMTIVRFHQLFLLGPEGRSGFFQWTGNELSYIGWSIVIWLLAAVIYFFFGLFVMPAVSLAFNIFMENALLFLAAFLFISIPVYYILARLTLMLPAVAIGDRPGKLAWSWQLSKGNGLRLTFLIFVIPAIFNVLIEFITFADSIFASIIYLIFWMVVGPIEIALLSLSYGYLAATETEQDDEDEDEDGQEIDSSELRL